MTGIGSSAVPGIPKTVSLRTPAVAGILLNPTTEFP